MYLWKNGKSKKKLDRQIVWGSEIEVISFEEVFFCTILTCEILQILKIL